MVMKLLVPDIPSADELLPYLRTIDESRWYTNHGPLVLELEKRLAAMHAGSHIVSTSSATLGLEIALLSFGIGYGRRALVPSLSFPATASVAVRAGLHPIYADVDPTSWNLTPEIAREALRREDFDVVIAVAAFGAEQDLEDWASFERETRVRVLVDAAAAFGNGWMGRHGIVTVVSLHATKALGAGEGGFIATPDGYRATFLRRLSNFGIDPTAMDGAAMWTGTNAKLSEYHAAVALAGLDRWTEKSAARIALSSWYHAALERCRGVVPQRRRIDAVYNTFVVMLPRGANPNAVSSALSRKGIQTRRWYCPPQHEHPGLRYPSAGPLSVTEDISRRLLGLPFHLGITMDDVATVCDALAEAIGGRG